jgi:hypothetical protein
MNLRRPVEFDKLDESHLEYDCCEHGNEPLIVIRTSSVILSLLLISCTGKNIRSAIFTK